LVFKQAAGDGASMNLFQMKSQVAGSVAQLKEVVAMDKLMFRIAPKIRNSNSDEVFPGLRTTPFGRGSATGSTILPPLVVLTAGASISGEIH